MKPWIDILIFHTLPSMLVSSDESMMHAKSALILGHTHTGMGEKSLAFKFKRAIVQAGYCVKSVVDIFDCLGEDYERLAQLNYDLADNHFAVIEDLKKDLTVASSDLLLILSWCFSVAALVATGIHKTRPTAAMLYAHHPQERILTKLYDPADLLITESLLANERAYAYGIDPSKVLYMPHSYPSECATIRSNRTYVEQLASKQGKKIDQHTKVIGCVGRLEYGKNCEYAVEAVRRLVLKKQNVALILKGDFPSNSPYPDYRPAFERMLQEYQNEPWLLWDRTATPFPDVLQEYASFDVLIHPSGAEGASHVVVECLGLNKPVIVLDCSTNPYLFKAIATFVKTTQKLYPAQVPFYVPDIDDLCQMLEQDLPAPDIEKVEERFHEKRLVERIPLLFDPDKKIIKELYVHDRSCYHL